MRRRYVAALALTGTVVVVAAPAPERGQRGGRRPRTAAQAGLGRRD